jgi:hypothetical protein
MTTRIRPQTLFLRPDVFILDEKVKLRGKSGMEIALSQSHSIQTGQIR